jgi:hypothetical protein
MAGAAFFISGAVLLAWLGGAIVAGAAPRSDLWSRWAAHDPAAAARIDHGPWDRFLKRYVIADDPSGVNLVRYGSVAAKDRGLLESYLEGLQEVPISRMSRPEQRAYWINLYNALTVKVVLDHRPVRSIRDIDISPGLFSRGPWGAKLLRIEGEDLSLDDIEHRILRPIWNDNRVHYAVNCASMGCPNLQPEAFTAQNTEGLLEKGARQYVNHPRVARFEGRDLVLSSIYDWFRADFGGTEAGVMGHLLRYAQDPLARRLKEHRGPIRYEYDWSLNESARGD